MQGVQHLGEEQEFAGDQQQEGNWFDAPQESREHACKARELVTAA